MVNKRIVDQLLANCEAFKLSRNVVGRTQHRNACRRVIGEVPVEEALIAAVVRRRGEVRVHHIVERRLRRLEDEDCPKKRQIRGKWTC